MARSAPTPIETILVVDDDPEVLSLAADILLVAGYTVRSTGDPQAALRVARTPREQIHLLLTDVVMPLMGGGQLAEEFRAIQPDARVLFMSAYNAEAVEAFRVRLAPGEPFLHKPFTVAGLENAVRAALVYRPPLTWSRQASPGR